MTTSKDLINAIKAYVDAKVDYEFASREEGADGYMATASFERKVLEEAEAILTKITDELFS